jgi:hypothetical protein
MWNKCCPFGKAGGRGLAGSCQHVIALGVRKDRGGLLRVLWGTQRLTSTVVRMGKVTNHVTTHDKGYS